MRSLPNLSLSRQTYSFYCGNKVLEDKDDNDGEYTEGEKRKKRKRAAAAKGEEEIKRQAKILEKKPEDDDFLDDVHVEESNKRSKKEGSPKFAEAAEQDTGEPQLRSRTPVESEFSFGNRFIGPLIFYFYNFFLMKWGTTFLKS